MMHRSVFQHIADSNNRLIDQETVDQSILKSFLTCRYIILRDSSSHNIIDKFRRSTIFVLRHRFNVPYYFRKLTCTTRLFLMGIVERRTLANSFAITDLGFSNTTFHPILPFHSLNVDIEMEFAHARNDRLFRL